MHKDSKIGHQSILCSVYDCIHCNREDEYCQLEKIKICDHEGHESKEATMCDSYDKR
jgi:hypothetical protein